jgi:hypothetical protein
MNIFLSIFYLLTAKSKLNPNNYYAQNLNISYFIQATKHDMIMHEKLQD